MVDTTYPALCPNCGTVGTPSTNREGGFSCRACGNVFTARVLEEQQDLEAFLEAHEGALDLAIERVNMLRERIKYLKSTIEEYGEELAITEYMLEEEEHRVKELGNA